MKRTWAVIVSAALLASCRTSQPTTNPFLRTTVPPPATSPGLVVTPGTPYAQGIAPPMVTSPAPPVVTTPAPVVTQPVPVAPAPVAPMSAQPVMPQGDRFNPPGGSYLFHQSSHKPPAARTRAESAPLAEAAKPGRVVVQACYAPPSDKPETVMSPDGFIENPFVVKRRKAESPQAVSRDGYIENPYVKPKGKVAGSTPAIRTKPTSKTSPRDRVPVVRTPPLKRPAPLAKTAPNMRAKPAAKPSQPVARLTLGDSPNKLPQLPGKVSVSTAGQGNLLRIVGESLPSPDGSTVVSTRPSAPATSAFRSVQSPPVSDGTVLRITAGALPSTVTSSNDPSPANFSVAVPHSVGDSSATFVSPDTSQPVVQATFQPVPSSRSASQANYAHSADYRTLRGRLEYSPGQRQWKLRYIPIDGQTDTHGGSVLLTASPDLESFQPGDYVVVEGLLTGGHGQAAAGDAPWYTATRLERLAR
jgi:hypothetical protein